MEGSEAVPPLKRHRRPSRKMREGLVLDSQENGSTPASALPRLSRASPTLKTRDPSRLGPSSAAAQTPHTGSEAGGETSQGHNLDRLRKELDNTLSEHDMLARELFHLTKFVTLVGYDPRIARQDESPVFEMFRTERGLNLETNLTDGPSSRRATRRGVSKRLAALDLRQRPPPACNTARSTCARVGDDKAARKRDSARDNSSVQPSRKREQTDPHDISRRSPSKNSSKLKTPVSQAFRQQGDKASTTAHEAIVKEGLLHEMLSRSHRQLPPIAPVVAATSYYQIPQPYQYGRLPAYWETFRYPGDSEDPCHPVEAQIWERKESANHAHIDLARIRGLMPKEPALAGILRPPTEPWLSKVISTANQDTARHAHKVRQQGKQRRALARKVSRMIQSYWSARLGERERDRKAEERHARTLARWTVREVNKHWKLAINVVRSQKAKQEKLDRERLGREQLSMILEQSTQYLHRREADLQQHRVEGMDGAWSDASEDIAEDSDTSENLSGQGSQDANNEHQNEASEGSSVASKVSEDDRSFSRSTSEHDSCGDARYLRDTSHMAELLSIHSSKRNDHDEIHVGSNVSLLDPQTHLDADDEWTPRPTAFRTRSIEPHKPYTKFQTPSRVSLALKDDHLSSHTPDQPSALEQPEPDQFRSSDSTTTDAAFAIEEDEEANAKDAELEKRMIQEDECNDSEDEGLLADAEIPLEELLRRYSEYNVHPEIATTQDSPQESQDSAEPDSEAASPDRVSSELPTPEPTPAESSPLMTAERVSGDREEQVGSGISRDVSTRSLRQPFLLRGTLRPYQQLGFEWLASLYANNANGILADEMGLGKTIQTIALLAHLACDKGVWGPHLVIAPTSVMLNWEVEFKKFLPGFKILSYFGSQRERKEKRIGWNTEHNFNVCITSYQIVLADQHIFRRKPWVYMVLDEAHHIKNFRSKRWQTLLGFNAQHRLLLTGTPLQNNLMDLWSLMYFLMPNGLTGVAGEGAFSNMKDFQDWFSNPLDKAVETGETMDEETRKMVAKLHTILRPFLLRRLKTEVERELPRKFEHVIRCRLSKRQRFLYNDFMSRAKTRESLASGSYLSIINCLMQLRKVCNHPDLFESRPIAAAFAMAKSVPTDYEPVALLSQKRLLHDQDVQSERALANSALFNVTSQEETSASMATRLAQRLDGSDQLPFATRNFGPSKTALDTRSIEGCRRSLEAQRLRREGEVWKRRAAVNQQRIAHQPVYGSSLLGLLQNATSDVLLRSEDCADPDSNARQNLHGTWLAKLAMSHLQRADALADTVSRFAFVPPKVMALDVPRHVMATETNAEIVSRAGQDRALDQPLHLAATKLQIAFPDAFLLQYDCGKLQELERLMRRLKEGKHRILIFTQMTRVLDILEAFLNLHNYRYLRLDGATKIDRRQALTEKFNRDPRIDAFILSTRSGGLGINLTGADTVLFYDLDWNSAIEAQCMDRAHRIGQTRDVHIYRFVSEATIEENMLRKADQKRMLDSVVIQRGDFTTETLKRGGWRDMLDDGGKTLAGVTVGEDDQDMHNEQNLADRDEERAFENAEDEEDQLAARAAKEELQAVHGTDVTEFEREDVEVEVEVDAEADASAAKVTSEDVLRSPASPNSHAHGDASKEPTVEDDVGEDEENDGSVEEYMLRFISADWSWFNSSFKV